MNYFFLIFLVSEFWVQGCECVQGDIFEDYPDNLEINATLSFMISTMEYLSTQGL
jgi:hypothetical protein